MTTTLDRPGRVLVLRGSPDHATAGIAEAVAAELVAAGLRVDVTVPSRVGGLAGYGAVVLGSRVRFGRWHPSVLRFLRRHAAVLSVRPLRLFAVGHAYAGPLDGPAPVTFPDGDLGAPRRWARRLAAELAGEPAGRE
ncbi:flavodoxin domain-containing protein [Pseudonocardia endophytica]|uniref:Menaquinone-dependent protoporphyrinogen IX oxidase n=1 Tax=Pseudonocardia endophytica TaxID=401976 RepID=A0A4V2PHW6_PSEEN|nr:flavodoxin domain-containing protein [Pseudonocardia endophytica]TCK22346.1 menaquinone-dependent protoporphyrinogen IX oxidase [Pseudonocardia endophytica]